LQYNLFINYFSLNRLAYCAHADLMELRHKRYFENPQERKKRKVKEARMRKKFERMQRRRTRMQETA